MATIKYLLKKSKVNKDGKSPLYVAIYHEDQTELIFTKEFIKATLWNNDNQCVRALKNLPEDAADIDLNIGKIKNTLLKIQRDLKAESDIDPSAVQIKAVWTAKHNAKKEVQKEGDKKQKEDVRLLGTKVDTWVTNLTHSPLTVKAITNSMKKFKLFVGPTFETKSLDKETCEAYAAALYNDKRWKLSRSSHGRHIKHLRWFLKGLTPRPFDYRDLKIDNAKTEIISLTWEELQKVQALKVDGVEKQKSKDLFLLGCYTCLRISDMRRLRSEYIHIDMVTGYKEIRLRTLKNKKEVEIPILDAAWEILTRYGMRAPKISEQKANKLIKEICQDAGIDQEIMITSTKGNKRKEAPQPKYELISLHVGGKTFISLAEDRWKLTPSQLAAVVGKDTRTIARHYKTLDSRSAKQQIRDLESREQEVATKQSAELNAAS